VITLYDADRCPYCARVRMVLAEKDVEHETVAVDLANRPEWLYEKNPLGKVPVIEEDSFVLPESDVIMVYLEERYPEPALLPPDPAARARVRLAMHRFDTNLGGAYYAYRRGEEGAADELAYCLSLMDRFAAEWPLEYGLADIAYLPWLIRLRVLLGVELPERLATRLDELAERPAVAAELDIVAALAR
jgi:RNA polymerase-associated protein